MDIHKKMNRVEKAKRTPIFSLTKKDFRIDRFRSGGKGGQHQNKTETGIRITHKETGISHENRTERSQLQNQKRAFQKLCKDKRFLAWIKLKALYKEKEIKEYMKVAMAPKNIKVEIRKNGKWEAQDEQG